MTGRPERGKKRALCACALGALLLCQPSHGSPFTKKCKEFLWGYTEEAVNSGGLRIFLRPENGGDVRYRRFLSSAEPRFRLSKWLIKEMPVRLITGIPDRQFTPLRGLYYTFLQKPVSDASQWMGLGRQQPTLPSLLLMSALFWHGVDVASNVGYQQEIESNIQTHAQQYDEFILYDFRFHDISDRFSSHQISRHKALEETYWRKLAIDQYYNYRMTENTTSPYEQLKFLDFFQDLKSVVANGVKLDEDFIVPSSAQGPLSEQQVLQLIQLNHQLFDHYQIISEMVHHTDFFQNAKTHSAFAKWIQKMTSDPFVVRVLKMTKDGDISTNEAQHILQEDIFWQMRFEEWKILGITKLKRESNETITSIPLTLSDIRNEVMKPYFDRRPEKKPTS